MVQRRHFATVCSPATIAYCNRNCVAGLRLLLKVCVLLLSVVHDLSLICKTMCAAPPWHSSRLSLSLKARPCWSLKALLLFVQHQSLKKYCRVHKIGNEERYASRGQLLNSILFHWKRQVSCGNPSCLWPTATANKCINISCVSTSHNRMTAQGRQSTQQRCNSC